MTDRVWAALVQALCISGFLLPLPALADKLVTVTVSAKVVGETPEIIGYNAGHYYPGSNTTSWWRWSGVNGVRMFISPKTIEPKTMDDIPGWGDGVNSQASFIARRKALRADPTNPKYINHKHFQDRFNNATLSGNIIRTAYALSQLKKLGVTGLAMMGRTVSSFPFAKGNPWADRWEHWQYHYAAAYYLASEFDLQRHQMYNEPNHSSNSNLSQGHYITRLRFASDAIQAAIADVNRDKKKSLVAMVQSPVTAGGGPKDFGSSGWGTLLLKNLHVDVLGNKDPKYFIAQTYAYHGYNQTGPAMGSALTQVNSKLAKVVGGKAMPVAITEFNAHTNSTYQTLKETPDSPSKVARLGSIVASLANARPRELYFFKFAQTQDTGNKVKKNGLHWVENKAKPYDVGGVTRGGAVVRLFAPAFKGARPLLAPPTLSGAGAADIRVSACRHTKGGRMHLLSTNTSGGAYLGIDLNLSAWTPATGARVLVQEVSEGAVAEVRASHDVPPSRKLYLRQPPRSVWLITVFEKAPGAKLALKPVADATVRAGKDAAKNFGSGHTLTARNHSSNPDQRSAALLRFDLGGVKAADVDLAVLELTGVYTGGNTSATAHVYGLAGDAWQESAVTWSKTPNLKATAGSATEIQHNFVAGVGTTAEILGHLTVDKKGGTRPVVVTDFVRAQADGEATFMLARVVRFPGDVDDKGGLVFTSRETKTAGPPPALRLYLRPGATLPKPDAGPPPGDAGAVPADKGAPAGDKGAPPADLRRDRPGSEAGAADAAPADAAQADAALYDAALHDAVMNDAAGARPGDEEGCSCGMSSGRHGALPLFVLLWLISRATWRPRSAACRSSGRSPGGRSGGRSSRRRS